MQKNDFKLALQEDKGGIYILKKQMSLFDFDDNGEDDSEDNNEEVEEESDDWRYFFSQ